jgi:hypothetical protein
MLPLSAYLRPAGLLPPAGSETDPSAQALRSARAADTWFNQGLGDDSRVLRAPAEPAGNVRGADLSQRFLGCLCDT